jgi:DNA-binding transcriptional ArsR family regulator
MSDVEVTDAGGTFQATPSLACDLSWVLSVVGCGDDWTEKYPARAQTFQGRPELAQRVLNFWSDASTCTSFTEMLVLAHHAGAMAETDPDALWAALERAIPTVPLDLPLESEDPDERTVYLQRLEKLQKSPALVQRYLELFRDVWDPINESWQAALPLLRDTGAHKRAELERGRPFHELLYVKCNNYVARLPIIIDTLEDPGQILLVVPCYYHGKSFYLELPGVTMIGIGVDEHGSLARARTESIARRLKTVADPTRLALLHYLSSRPSSVSDLAASFGLAQPTVSMHVKLLRETGLVLAERQSGRLQLRADFHAVDTLVSDLRSVVIQPAHHGDSLTGMERMPATVVEETRSATPVTA